MTEQDNQAGTSASAAGVEFGNTRAVAIAGVIGGATIAVAPTAFILKWGQASLPTCSWD